MKSIITLIIIFSLSGCMTYHEKYYFQKVDGTWISKRKYERISHKAWKHAIRSLSKEDRKLLFDVPVRMEIDTTKND